MKTRASGLIVAALSAAAFTAFMLRPGEAQVPPGAMFQTGCAAVDETTVEGFVTNPGTGMIRVDGLVRFSFTVANSMSRPAVQVQASALVPPGRTLSVARAKLVWSLLPGEVCQLDVSGAVR